MSWLSHYINTCKGRTFPKCHRALPRATPLLGILERSPNLSARVYWQNPVFVSSAWNAFAQRPGLIAYSRRMACKGPIKTSGKMSRPAVPNLMAQTRAYGSDRERGLQHATQAVIKKRRLDSMGPAPLRVRASDRSSTLGMAWPFTTRALCTNAHSPQGALSYGDGRMESVIAGHANSSAKHKRPVRRAFPPPTRCAHDTAAWRADLVGTSPGHAPTGCGQARGGWAG